MDAKELDGLLSGVPVEIARSAWGKDAITFLQSFYRLLAATEGSEDAIVRELRGQHCRDFGSDPQCDADGLCICAMHERAAAALVAERAAKEKAEADLVARERTWNTAMNASDRTTSEWRRACKQAEAERDELKRHAELLPILASVWFFGDFKAETFHERLMQTIMESAGLWPIADDRDLDEKVAAYRAAFPKDAP